MDYRVAVTSGPIDVTWIVDASTPLGAQALMDALASSVSFGDTTDLQRALREHHVD